MTHNEVDHQVGILLSKYNIQVPNAIRANLRPLNYITYHKTLVDALGNFLALVTDGTIAWIRLSDEKETIITVQLLNIAQPTIEHSDETKPKPKLKPTKPPSPKQLAKLRALLDLGEDFLTPHELLLLKNHK